MFSKKLPAQMIDETLPSVNPERLRKQRLEKLQSEIRRSGVGGLILYDPVAIRYATGTRVEAIWTSRRLARYAIVPARGEPILYELSYAAWWSSKVYGRVKPAKDWDFFFGGTRRPELAKAWAADVKQALKELGIYGEKIGIDKLDVPGFHALKSQGIEVADGLPIFERARIVKTPDEVEMLKISCSVAEHGIDAVRGAIRPGVRETELFGLLGQTILSDGGEHLETRLLLSGGNTNPWMGETSSKMVRSNDLVGIDTDMVGPGGYGICLSRTYLCGNNPTPEQKKLHKFCYEFVYGVINILKPGMKFSEVSEKAPQYPREYKAQRYPVICHGLGMGVGEYPAILFNDVAQNEDDTIKENMILTAEAYVGKVGGQEGVKLGEVVHITAGGVEIISSAPYDEKLLG